MAAEPRIDENNEVFCLRSIGSDEGARDVLTLLMERGVIGATGDRLFPVIFLANFRNGDIDLDIALVELPALEERDPLGGVARYPFDVVPEALDPASLTESP